MFKEERDSNKFVWDDLADLEKGRPNLGLTVPVLAYRLLQYTFRDFNTVVAEEQVTQASKKLYITQSALL